jgi:hypothetical protein
MPQTRETQSTAWQQFLVAKTKMLDDYDRALVHAKEQVVQVHHGVVGEASVREWLHSFLPKRYGVVNGYIRSQNPSHPYQSRHFDVIVYDQIESPTLWIENNNAKSDSGRMRIIPAEFVRAVVEVKSAFKHSIVKEATEKLSELEPLMSGVDPAGEQYPRYLPASAVLAMLFFEYRIADLADQQKILSLFQTLEFRRLLYGAVILRGEGSHADNTAIVQRYESQEPHTGMNSEGMTKGMTLTPTQQSNGRNIGVMMTWTGINFSRFAFDLLAFLRGTYRPGFLSSFHGFDFSHAENCSGPPPGSVTPL